MIWYHLCVESKGEKDTQMNLLPKQELTHRHRKQTYVYQKAKGRLGEG